MRGPLMPNHVSPEIDICVDSSVLDMDNYGTIPGTVLKTYRDHQPRLCAASNSQGPFAILWLVSS